MGGIALEVRNLGCRAAGIHDVTFAVRRGEIIGIAQLAETLFGLTPAFPSKYASSVGLGGMGWETRGEN